MPPEESHRIPPETRLRARELRKALTPAEQKLWQILRNRNLGDYKFRRQHPIGPFIADFCCIEVGLVIEVDGGCHLDQADYDQARTAWLEGLGYNVVRFWNNDVLNNLDEVAQEILEICDRLKTEGCDD